VPATLAATDLPLPVRPQARHRRRVVHGRHRRWPRRFAGEPTRCAAVIRREPDGRLVAGSDPSSRRQAASARSGRRGHANPRLRWQWHMCLACTPHLSQAPPAQALGMRQRIGRHRACSRRCPWHRLDVAQLAPRTAASIGEDVGVTAVLMPGSTVSPKTLLGLLGQSLALDRPRPDAGRRGTGSDAIRSPDRNPPQPRTRPTRAVRAPDLDLRAESITLLALSVRNYHIVRSIHSRSHQNQQEKYGAMHQLRTCLRSRKN
jgi:hypothetical protein